jgi:hypothetical protein
VPRQQGGFSNVMQGMIELIKKDADKAFEGLDFADEIDGMDSLNIKKP